MSDDARGFEGDIRLALRALPHRYPFLLVDRVLEFEREKHIVAVKNVTANEPQFTGHFPDFPVMPGVLLLEAMAQTCGLLKFLSEDAERRPDNELLYLTGCDDVRFRRVVVPGDRVILRAELLRRKRNYYSFQTRAMVDDAPACEAKIFCAVSEKS